MQALAEFAALVHGGNLNMSVDVSVSGLTHRFLIGSHNSLVLQRIEVSINNVQENLLTFFIAIDNPSLLLHTVCALLYSQFFR